MKPIEDPDSHALIAENVCEWDWSKAFQAWRAGNQFITDDPVKPFKGAANRETAIEAARLKGWYIDIGSLTSGYSTSVYSVDFDFKENVFPIYTLQFDADQMIIYPTRAAAEFAALLWVAQQIAENND